MKNYLVQYITLDDYGVAEPVQCYDNLRNVDFDEVIKTIEENQTILSEAEFIIVTAYDELGFANGKTLQIGKEMVYKIIDYT